MKNFYRFLFLLLLFPLPLLAQQPPAAANPAPMPPLSDISAAMLGKVTFTEEVDGVEKDLGTSKIIWDGDNNHLDWFGLDYGGSKSAGKRYLRIAYENPMEIGTVMAAAGGALSFLKPGVAAPGNISDDSQWIAAERIQNNAVTTTAEADHNDIALWVLPPGTITQAFRFTHEAQSADKTYNGWLGGVALLHGRVTNLSPQSTVRARSNNDAAPALKDENRSSPWSNIESNTRDHTLSEEPEWITFNWPKPVTIQGLGFIWTGFGLAELQTYVGPKDQSIKVAREQDWKTVQKISGLTCHYPLQLDLNLVSLDTPLTTQAIRIRITGALDEAGLHPHMKGGTRDGKRAWLGELITFNSLEEASVASALPPAPKVVEVTGAIPIKFTLPEDGNVTLVVEDSQGVRVRNLISDTPMKKGENTIYWDGTNDLGRDDDATNHGLYSIPLQFVDPGSYTVRGLWHKAIDLRYEMSFYSPGDPPWDTADGTGAWMTNHTPADAVAFVPKNRAPDGNPVTLIGAFVSEGGSCLSWVDGTGRKLGGRGWIGGNWTGALHLAVDTGDSPEAGVSAYVATPWRNQKDQNDEGTLDLRLTKLSRFTDNNSVISPNYTDTLPPLPPRADGRANPRDMGQAVGGLAVHNGLIVISMPMYNQLLFVDGKKGQVLGKAPLPSPRGVAFDSNGKLLVLNDTSLLRYTLAAVPYPLGTPEKLASGLEDPSGITLDSVGQIYISLHGNSNQVKVFSPNGKWVMTYGQAGPIKAGIYNPLHMNTPAEMAVDDNHRLWVAENDYHPKRVSVWNQDGTLWKAFYGPPTYGGGGVMDPHDSSKILYDGMEFQADLKTGASTLTRVYYRPSVDLPLPFFNAGLPEMPAYFHGKRYLTNCFNSNPTNGSSIGFIFLDKNDVAVPVAAMGRANDWDLLKSAPFKSLWTGQPDAYGNLPPTYFTWSDLNNDGKVEPEEVKMAVGPSGSLTVGDDGSFLMANLNDGSGPTQAYRFKPVRFTDTDVPVYDLAQKEALAPAQGAASDGNGQMLVGTDGWLVQTTAPPPFPVSAVGGSKNGKASWSYPSLWPGLHPSHSAPAPGFPGELLGTTRLLGNLVDPKGGIGPLFVINCNQGDAYCFTQDGLFVTQFFEDMRWNHLWQMPVAQHNMRVNNVSLHDENFFPAISQTVDGTVYFMGGGIPAVVRVDGLDTLKRIAPIPLKITSEDLQHAARVAEESEATRQAAAGNDAMIVGLGLTAVVDGHLDEWGGFDWIQIDRRGSAAWFDANTKPYNVSGAVAVNEGKLFAAWKTGDKDLLRNSGAVPNGLFKTGGALDLMIGTNPKADPHRTEAVAGDVRLLVSQVNGKTSALLYRPVVPGTDPKSRIPFSAPWHSIYMDQVDDVSDKVQLGADGDGNYEISVPLDVLGLAPDVGVKIKADMGILRGNGTQTNQRVYWNNKATAIVSDVPSEAQLTPDLWGTWDFELAPPPQK